MLKGDNIVCGTTSTGTGTLTLAATPVAPGGVDFDVLARATGIGFGNSAAVLVSYTITEYTDATFATAKSHEKGVGTLTLGSSSGIANCTLARTKIQTSATSLNSQPATQNILPGTGISIATAANTLVFIGASAADIVAMVPFIEGTGQNLNGNRPMAFAAGNLGNTSVGLNNDQDIYSTMIWPYTMLVKRAILYVDATYTGQNNNVYVRLYAIGTDGRPGKLLCDFGQIGTLNASLAATGAIATGALTNGFLLTPGEYYYNIGYHATGGGTGTPTIHADSSPIISGRTGTQGAATTTMWYNNATVSGTPSDPAAQGGLGAGATTYVPWIAFKPA